MKRPLSSIYTRLNQVVSVLIPAAVFVIVLLNILGGAMPLFPVGVIALALSCAALAFFSWPYARLCEVSADENNLYVSRGAKESVIPLTAVTDVTFVWGLNLVVVRLNSTSDFGDKFAFMPIVRSRRYQVRIHPTVDELRLLVKKACANSEATT